MNQLDRIQKQIGDVSSRDMKTLEKELKKKEEANSKKHILEVNSAFDGLISRLDMAEEIIS